MDNLNPMTINKSSVPKCLCDNPTIKAEWDFFPVYDGFS